MLRWLNSTPHAKPSSPVHNRPLCIFCRRPVGPHKVASCVRWVEVERDWVLWKFGKPSRKEVQDA